MSATLVRPAPERVAERAREIVRIIETDPEFARLRTACAKYDEDTPGAALCITSYTVRSLLSSS